LNSTAPVRSLMFSADGPSTAGEAGSFMPKKAHA